MTVGTVFWLARQLNNSTSVSTTVTNQVTDLADLKRKSVRGGIITFVSQGASFLIQLTSTVILARLLSPNDYGIIAMVTAVTAFAGLFRDLGLSSAAIQKQSLTNAQQSNLFWINLALGALLSLLLASVSPFVAWFYHRPEVTWVTLALSVSFLIGSLGAQSAALLIREMRFGRKAIAALSGSVLSVSVSVVLALAGYRYWSLVWGQLAGVSVTSALLFCLSSFRPGMPCRGTGVKMMLKFGMHVTAFDFVNYFHRNLDSILIGRICGAEPLGLYSRAYSLLMFPIANLRGPINAVGFPAMSRLQNQPEAFRTYYIRVTSLLALLSMPLTAYLFLSSEPVIQLLLGRQWLGVAPIFSWLAVVSFVQPVVTLWGMVALSSGRTRRYLHLGIFNTVCSALGFLAGIHWGAVGVAAGYAAATYLSLYPILTWTFRGTPIRFRDFLFSVLRPMVASLTALTACLCILPLFTNHSSPVYQLLSTAVVFGLVCLATLLCLPGGKAELRRFLKLLSACLGSRRQPPDQELVIST